MPYQNKADGKYCSTCEYWTGGRELSRSGGMFYVRHDGRTAKCEVNGLGGSLMDGNCKASGCKKIQKVESLAVNRKILKISLQK